MSPWLTVVGIGEDGLSGLSPAARALVEAAPVLAGAARQLALVPEGLGGERLEWTGLETTIQALLARRGQPVVLLASGEPLWFGLAATLARRLGPGEMTVIPAPGAFSLAAARLGWPLQDVLCLTAHGRPVEGLSLHFAPGARLLVLAEAATAPALARLLTTEGYGPSRLIALSHLGGPQESRREAPAEDWQGDTPALSTLAVEVAAAPGTRPRARTPGLPDEAFQHDGQLTKREVRAVTLAALGPWPGAVLWDVGAGNGSVAIEWLRAAAGTRAVAIERDAARRARMAANALALGVPGLEIHPGPAPDGLEALGPAPDALFVGGGVSAPGMLAACWRALKPGGVLVANAVTLEAEAALLAFRAERGGDLLRLAVSRLKPVGGLTGWDTLAPITQLRAEKLRAEKPA